MEAKPGDEDQAVGSEQRAKAQEFKNTGNDKFNKSNYKGAVVDYHKGLLHEPNNPDLHANLSAAYLHLEKYIEAEEHALFSIHLRPNFYKGYMRAAKADHGKGMTRLALKRLAQGLSNVTDPNGVKELNRLKNQYTAYLSLQSNSERQLDFDSDTYQSEDDEDEGLSTDDDSSDDNQPERPRFRGYLVPVQPAPPAPSDAQALPPTVVPLDLNPKVENQKPEESVEPVKTESASVEVEETKESAEPVKTESASIEEEPKKPVEQTENETGQIQSNVETDESKVSTDQLSESQNETPYVVSSDKKPEHPLDWIRDISRTSEMKKNIADFKENLKVGGEAYLSGNYRKAADNYKAAYEGVGKRYLDFETDERQCNVIRYASYTAMINLNTYDDIVKGIHGLNDMTKFAFDFPAIYLQIARAYYKLNRFKTALEPLEKLQEIIGSFPIFPTFTWPGTNETMEETTPNGLKNSIKELNQLCRMSHKPKAVCRFDNCLKTSSHIQPSELIYFNDPDFIGYVRMICEGKCHIEFHISCWKSYKESICGIGKINDKDLLGRSCLTMDCINSEGVPSIITTIEIIDSDGQVKSVNRFDPKANSEQKAAEKKAKKKRSKLDDKESKEKVAKSKKPKEKEKKVKSKEKKLSPITQEDVNDEEEENEHTRLNTRVDYAKVMQIRRESLKELRTMKFGVDEKHYFDPRYSFYGNSEESMKASKNQYLDQSSDSIEVKDAKEFIFSYFYSILKDEGPLKLSEVEDLWKESAGDFCDITVVLPDLKEMCEQLMESSRFCQIEDRLCLSEQLEETYETARDELVETVNFVMSGGANCETDSQQTDSTKDLEHEDAASSSAESDSYNETDSDSDDSEDEGSDRDEAEVCTSFASTLNFNVPSSLKTEPANPPSGEVSFEDISKEMTLVVNSLLEKRDRPTSPTVSENYPNKDQPDESVSNETFETAHGSSANTTSEDIKANASDTPNSVSSNDDQRVTISSDHMDSEDTVVHTSTNLHDENAASHSADNSETQEPFESTECDKGSQSEIPTEERQIQTAPLETKDRLSQTKESDLYRELNKRVQELESQISAMNKENARLGKELLSEKQVQKAQQEAIARLQEQYRHSSEAHKTYQELMKSELSRKDKEYKKKEDELTKSINNMKEVYTSLLQENNHLKNEKSTLLKEYTVANQSLTAALTNNKELEKNSKTLEVTMQGRLQKALQAQLTLINTCWETQFNVHKMRCVEKITEIQSWFNVSAGEVESLPSYPLIQQNILQWIEMGKQLRLTESEFQAKYKEIEKIIKQGNDIDDLRPEMMPAMPKEPMIPPLDRIHKEITEKHLKTISELTQLVATQQLQIEKSKDQAEQMTKMLMNTFGSNTVMTPRLPQPVTTAFGSLALQYPYPGAVSSQFSGPSVSAVPPTSQDSSRIGNPYKLPDVQTLLQESSKIFSSQTQAPSLLSPALKDESRSQTPPVSNSYSFPPPLMSQPPAALSMPPPPMGVAQSLLQNSEQKKDIKPPEQRARTPKLEQKVGSSRESTPGPASTPAVPTPEKSKKKKKVKSGEAAAAEARIAAAVSLESATAAAEDDSNGWNIVLPKSAIPKQPVQPAAPSNDCKLKNKKKLLDKLQARFTSTPLNVIDDIVKQVRENNNGSLSGLPFDEIEARVERIILKRHIQKNSTMGLVKFSDAAWGTVKPQEIKAWSNVQLEECTICLELMGNDRTKVDCNHEFHTKCLRKWLKEKSVCPLCNKFTTMPDEFPAL